MQRGVEKWSEEEGQETLYSLRWEKQHFKKNGDGNHPVESKINDIRDRRQLLELPFETG